MADDPSDVVPAAAPDTALDPWWAEGFDEEQAWRTTRPGPAVIEIAERLSSIPRPFLADDVDLVALAGDVLPDEVPGPARLMSLLVRLSSPLVEGGPGGTAAVAALLWLHASVDLVGPFSEPLRTDLLLPAVAAAGLRLGPVLAPERWLTDADRREEVARLLLLWSGLRPAGEDTDSARARFEMHDSVRRDAALARARADHEHRQRVQDALQAQRAREAAARYKPE